MQLAVMNENVERIYPVDYPFVSRAFSRKLVSK